MTGSCCCSVDDLLDPVRTVKCLGVCCPSIGKMFLTLSTVRSLKGVAAFRWSRGGVAAVHGEQPLGYVA